MRKKRSILCAGIIALTAIQCTKTEASDPFLIQQGQIGKLIKETTVAALDSVYASDSIVKRIGEGDYVYANKDKYLIYEKGGKHLLTLTPAQQYDSTEIITNIRIIDPRFKTDKGLHVNSTFKAIKEQYTISKINTTFNNILVFVDEIDAYFTIDKKELPQALQQLNTPIKAEQIPDTAKIKYFMIGWE